MPTIDNTLAAQVPTFDPVTPLREMAQLQAAQQEIQQAKFKQNQTEMGAEMRGLQPFVNSPEFPAKWREAADKLRQRGVIDDQMHQQWANAPSPLLMKSIISKTEDPALSFRREEAQREQQNQNRSFGLQKTNADRNYGLAVRAADRADEGALDAADDRAKAATKYGFDPNSPQGKAFVLTGKIPEGADTSLLDAVNQRKASAVANGLMPDHPGYQSFILTGKMPREDAQPLTAGDKEAIRAADDSVVSNRAAIDSLKRAKDLSKQAFVGPAAGPRGYAASFLGESSDMGKGGIATENLTNEVMTNALSQLKPIFGGNPTEGERKILLDLQGSVNKPDAVRQAIFDRAIGLAQKRLDFNQQRADELRGGSYYKNKAPKDAEALKTQAREAIEAGAPRDAVIQRLKQQGVDASGI